MYFAHGLQPSPFIFADTPSPLILPPSPNAVEYLPVGEDPDVDVWHDDLVLPRLLLVAEEGVGHPNLGRIGHRQVLQTTCLRERY